MSVEEITLAKRIQMFEESSIYPVVSPEFCNGRAVTDVVAAIMAVLLLLSIDSRLETQWL